MELLMSLCRFKKMLMSHVSVAKYPPPPCPPLPPYPVEFKKCQCPMSLYIVLANGTVQYGPCHSVEFKKWPCRPFDFRGSVVQGLLILSLVEVNYVADMCSS